jgi:ABC-type glycerol-3-phosphate transport system substrate-binding protein
MAAPITPMSEGIDKDSRVPLYKQVRQYLADLIVRGGSSGMLPPEVEISERLGVSRATVRSAIMDLVRDGQLVRVPGKGTFIRRASTRLVFSNWLSVERMFQPVMREIVERFAAANTGIEIENVGIEYEHSEHQLMLMTSAGRAPDIAALIYLWIPIFAYQGAILPLDELYTPEVRRRIHPQAAAAVNFQGHPYAFSWGNAPLILHANRRVVADYLRTDRLTPENFDELAEWIALLAERAGGKVIPYSIPFQDDEMLFLYSIYTFLLAFGGGVISQDNEVIFGCAENARAFAWMRAFISRGSVDISRTHLENRQLFACDRLAFLIEGPWLQKYLPALNPSCGARCDHLEFSVLPRGPLGTSPSLLWNHTLAIFRQCRNLESALAFVRYATQDPTVSEMYYRQTGMLPVFADEVQRNPAYDDTLGRVLRRQMENAQPIPFSDSPLFMTSIAFCARASREILLGESDIPRTLATYAGLLKELVKK